MSRTKTNVDTTAEFLFLAYKWDRILVIINMPHKRLNVSIVPCCQKSGWPSNKMIDKGKQEFLPSLSFGPPGLPTISPHLILLRGMDH